MSKKQSVVSAEQIAQRILVLRGHKVMLDSDLADLYGVETRVLLQSVKRNARRFPNDFMFQISTEEFKGLRSQFVISNKRRGGRRYLPYVFTEQGTAMLSSILKSERAIRVNIEIMRAFVRLREMMTGHKDLARRLDAMEKRYDAQFKVVFDALRELMTPPEPKKRRIGFLIKEKAALYGRT